MGDLKPSTYGSTIKTEPKTASVYRDMLVEFVATFCLVAVQCALPLDWNADQGTLLVGIGMGGIIIAMAETFGPFGGAHMNPAVTFAMIVAIKVTLFRGFLYMCAQCVGGIAGAGFVYWLSPENVTGTLAATEVNELIPAWKGMFIEMWITFILVITILGATNARRKPVYMASLPIGMAVMLGILSAAPYTGASMNPARSLGPAVVMDIWENHWVYWVGPFAGALLATIIYVYIVDKIPDGASDGDGESDHEMYNVSSKGQSNDAFMY